MSHNNGVHEPGAALKLTPRAQAIERRSLARVPRRLRAVLAGFALLALSCASSGAPGPLSEALPFSIPTAAVRAAWERIDGDYDTASEHVRYSLFVDPERPGLYRITHYRVSRRIAGADGRARLAQGAETVIWNETPGRRVPLRCFAEERRHGWRSMWRDGGPSWRDVSPTTAEFRDHMMRAIQIYYRVRAEGRAGPPVG